MKLKYLLSILISVFLSGAVFAQTAAPTPQIERSYVLGPGDQISVKVLGEEQFDFVATVDEDGRLTVPFHDEPVVAKCRSESELRGQIKTLLGKYLKNPQLNLQITKRTIQPATIYGEVNKPQEIELRRKATLIEILAVSNGVKEEAGGTIQVFRPVKPPCEADSTASWRTNPKDPTDTPSRTFSLSNLTKGGEDVNPIIYPGDVIIVHKAPPVYITGEVVLPGGVYLKESGLTLTEAIGKIGGLKRSAKTKDILIKRKKPDSNELEYISVNYDLIKTQKQPDIVLKPYDIIEVDLKVDSLGMTVLKTAIGLAQAGATAAATGGGYRAVIY